MADGGDRKIRQTVFEIVSKPYSVRLPRQITLPEFSSERVLYFMLFIAKFAFNTHMSWPDKTKMQLNSVGGYSAAGILDI
jgi:hypothetical protein